MLPVLGAILVVVGLLLVLLAVLVWLGVVTPKKDGFGKLDTSWPDVVKEILSKVPWIGIVGLGLIYVGLKALGVDLPPS